MRIRKVLAATALGAALVAGVAVPAQAAAPAPAARAVSATTAMGEMVFYDDFWTHSECQRVGRAGQKAKMWRLYSCQESFWDWDLYVAY